MFYESSFVVSEDDHHKPDLKMSLVANKDKAKEAREINSIPHHGSQIDVDRSSQYFNSSITRSMVQSPVDNRAFRGTSPNFLIGPG